MSLFLKQLELTNFKSYLQAKFSFAPKLNLIYGLNGVGKTNMLDAIYCISMTQSYAKIPDQALVHQGQDFYRVAGRLSRGEREHELVLKYRRRTKKVFEKDGVCYERLAHHIGFLPIVMVTPDDIELVNGGNAVRRTLLDRTISQVDQEYLDHSLKYVRLLKQRNAMLKQFQDGKPYDETLVNTYDQKLVGPARYIYRARGKFASQFASSLRDLYALLSDGAEAIEFHYECQTNPDHYLSAMLERRDKDRILGRTTLGPHADKLTYIIDQKEMKTFGSQGQKKSAIFATKLAQYQFLANSTGMQPLLILDDIFDRLDHMRVRRLLDIVLQSSYGQIFLSDTESDRVKHFFSTPRSSMACIEIKDGLF